MLPELTRSNLLSSNRMENITPTDPTGQTGSNRQPWLTTQTDAPPLGHWSANTPDPLSQRQSSPKKDFWHLIMETQHQGMLQVQADRAASAARIARLEEAILLLSVKSEATSQPTAALSSTPGGIDLQRFRTADGPSYVGPF
ncbi:hypothetical protein PCANC_10775 [Puccinia coronata f. sp. avenae]|uniref:Uncharacterized protein n=1 Tax=Puccinia coronata f. sp. avenae TaxID=200324 RepID=A0A2N5VSQ2_9BASI|nr:hypothetical protein PCANC_10775 [Puccinia coronata f. sp. avenae]